VAAGLGRFCLAGRESAAPPGQADAGLFPGCQFFSVVALPPRRFFLPTMMSLASRSAASRTAAVTM